METGTTTCSAILSLRCMLRDITVQIIEKLDDVLLAVIVVVIAWLLAKFVRGALRSVAIRVKADTRAMFIVARIAYVAVMVGGVLIALGIAGVNWTALATSLGLTGFALGFALKDAISNFLAGLLLLFYRPFQIGDKVKAGNITGVVKEIRVRDTVIIDENGLKTIVPNSNVFGNVIVNYTESTKETAA